MKEKTSKINLINNIIYFAVLFIMIIIIIMYRVDVWIKEPCFFGDEGALVYNIQTKSFFQLFSGLDNAQSCPLVFLLFNKIVYSIFGLNEQALRFYPFFTGILAVCFVPLLCKKIFDSKYMSLIFIPILAFNKNVVYYSQEIKQYSSDVLFTIIYFIIFYTFKDKIKTPKDALIIGSIFGISGFLSICSEFIVAPMLFYFLYKFIKDKNKSLIINFFVPYFILSLILFFTTVLPSMNNGILDCWTDAQFAFETIDAFRNTINYLLSNSISEILLFGFLFIGLILILLKDRLLTYVLLCPLVLHMISGFMHLYPFTNNRFILYLLVNLIIICIYPICFFAKTIISDKVLRNFIIMLLGIYVFIYGYNIRKIQYEELPYYFIRCSAREYVNILNTRNVLPDDIIFVDMQGDGSFIIYDTNKKYINKNRILNMVHCKPINVYDSWGQINTLDEVPVNSNIYFYNSRFYLDSADIDTLEKWLLDNCEILYSQEDILGTLLYVKKIK